MTTPRLPLAAELNVLAGATLIGAAVTVVPLVSLTVVSSIVGGLNSEGGLGSALGLAIVAGVYGLLAGLFVAIPTWLVGLLVIGAPLWRWLRGTQHLTRLRAIVIGAACATLTVVAALAAIAGVSGLLMAIPLGLVTALAGGIVGLWLSKQSRKLDAAYALLGTFE